MCSVCKTSFVIYKVSFFQGKRLHKKLTFDPPIQAVDGDTGVRAPLKYELVSGPKGVFSLDANDATLFLEKEVDLDTETELSG